MYHGLGLAVASVAGTAVPYQTRSTISLRSIAHATAWRTRTSLNGGFVQLNMIMSGLYGRLGDTASSLDFENSATRCGGIRCDPVQLAGLQAGQAHAVVADRAEHDLVEVAACRA